MAKSKYAVGSKVVFKGYADEVPEAERFLTEDGVYTVEEVNAEEDSIAIKIDNPDFNPKRKETEENSKTVLVDVFYDEVEPAPAAAPAKAKCRVAKAAPVEAEADADDDTVDPDAADADDDVVEEAPPPKAKVKGKAVAEVIPAKAKGKVKADKKADKKAKSKLAPKAAPVVEELPVLETEDEEITTLIEEADDILELAEELVEDSSAIDYKLGGVLYHVRLGKAYQKLDKSYKENGGFGLYVKERLNIDYRKAMYLIDIYYKFNLYGIDAEKVQELGWTKCSKIASVMSEDNAEELVELASNNSVSELSDTLKESYSKASAGTDGDSRKKLTIKLRLWDDQATAVNAILADVQAQMGFKDPAEAFEHIIMEWAAEHDFAVATEKKVKAKAKAATAEAAPAKAKARRVAS